MRKNLFFIFLLSSFFLPAISEARINILDIWHPGQDMAIAQTGSYHAIASFKAGENFLEIPVHFNYIPAKNIEAGGAWGLKSVSGKTGLNDLLLAIKYQFLDGQGANPAVIGEVAGTLPTADSTRGLGLGAAGLWLHWALEKKFEEFTGYFGIGLGIFGENSDKVREGNIFMYHIGTSAPYKNKYRLNAELKGFNHGYRKVNGVDIRDSYQEVYLAPGINYYWKKKHTLSASILIGLTSDSNDLGLFLASTF